MNDPLEKKLEAVATLAQAKGSNMSPRMVRQALDAASNDVFKKTGFLPWEKESGLGNITERVISEIRRFENRCKSNPRFIPFLNDLLTEKEEMVKEIRAKALKKPTRPAPVMKNKAPMHLLGLA